MNESPKPKLKPLIYRTNTTASGSPQHTQQVMLLKALQVTQDPKKLKQMIGVRTIAEVYRTLDKLAMRKEYHEALARCGISFEFIINGIKDIASGSEKDDTRLKAYLALLKSLGLEKYDIGDGTGSGTWEEELIKSLNSNENKKSLPPGNDDNTEYHVEVPEVPEEAQKLRETERELVDPLYE